MKFVVMGYPIWGWLVLVGIVGVTVVLVMNPGERADPCARHELGSIDYQLCEERREEEQSAATHY